MAQTKTTAIINEAFALYCHSYFFEHCKAQIYSICKDGLNEAGIEKMSLYYEKFSSKGQKVKLPTIFRYLFNLWNL